MKPHHGKPRRGMTKVASRFNGWYSGDGYKRAFRYATTTLWCRVPKGTLSTDTDKPAIEMAGCRCLMPTASAVRNLLNLYFYSHAEALSFSQSHQGLRVSSNRVEKANDLLVAKRQKDDGMSWSERGSSALAVITALSVNNRLSSWLRGEKGLLTMSEAEAA